MKVNIINDRYYVNALTPNAKRVVETGIIAKHRRTEEEKYLDCLLPDDTFATAISTVRSVLGVDYRFDESVPLDKLPKSRKEAA